MAAGPKQLPSWELPRTGLGVLGAQGERGPRTLCSGPLSNDACLLFWPLALEEALTTAAWNSLGF